MMYSEFLNLTGLTEEKITRKQYSDIEYLYANCDEAILKDAFCEQFMAYYNHFDDELKTLIFDDIYTVILKNKILKARLNTRIFIKTFYEIFNILNMEVV